MEELTPLTKQEAKEFLKHVKAPDWPSPQGMKAIKEAVLANQKRVTFDGKTYLISYGYRRTYPVTQETVDSIRLNREDGTFIPMGYIPIKTIMDA